MLTTVALDAEKCLAAQLGRIETAVSLLRALPTRLLRTLGWVGFFCLLRPVHAATRLIHGFGAHGFGTMAAPAAEEFPGLLAGLRGLREVLAFHWSVLRQPLEVVGDQDLEALRRAGDQR